MKFDLHRPCVDCPFLKKGGLKRLSTRRALEIAKTVATNSQGEIFPCHKTVDYSEGSDGRTTSDSQFCAGALLFMEKVNPAGSNAICMAERLSLYNRRKYTGSELVFDSVAEMILAQRTGSRRAAKK